MLYPLSHQESPSFFQILWPSVPWINCNTYGSYKAIVLLSQFSLFWGLGEGKEFLPSWYSHGIDITF